MDKKAQQVDEPIIPASTSLPEITLKVIILGSILTIVLASANAYLGLKVGTTVSASIPAAVISMGILRFFRRSNVLENNMVQIMASVGEALTGGIAFILPALLILHIWTRFDYWQTVATGLLGGCLGVLFTIPLRRALLKDRSLRYPEAIAIANVLKASTTREKGDLRLLTLGGLVGGLIALFQTGFQVLTESFSFWIRGNTFVYGFGLGLSPALIAAGYIVGINVALSVFAGIFIGWIVGVPFLTWFYGMTEAVTANQMAMVVWDKYIRYVGVGTMLIGGLWTMVTLMGPVFASMRTSFTAIRKINRNQVVLRTERDIPIHYVMVATLLLAIPMFWLMSATIIPADVPITQSFRYFMSGFTTLYVIVAGFIFCSISAYFAGLIGSTNNPVSGMSVSVLLIICLIFLGIFSFQTGWDDQLKEEIGVTLAIGSLVIVGAALAISNDTMQDLKVGQIVGSTPWKQQTMLFLGVLVSAFVIPPILQLLYDAYGIGGAFPRPGMPASQMLAAPQAGLMATVAHGAFSYQLRWGMIGAGAVIAVIAIMIDEYLKRTSHSRFPVLAVGLGIYLPLDSSVPIIIGGGLSYLIQLRLNKMYPVKNPENELRIEKHRHFGLLQACGIVAGASIMGVILAIPFAFYQSSDALKIMPVNLDWLRDPLSLLVTLLLCFWIYRAVVKPLRKV